MHIFYYCSAEQSQLFIVYFCIEFMKTFQTENLSKQASQSLANNKIKSGEKIYNKIINEILTCTLHYGLPSAFLQFPCGNSMR